MVSGKQLIVALLVIALVLGSLPGTVAAQDRSGVGGTVVVEEGETVDEVSAVAGAVVVDGTVTGDVSALAGTVYVNGEVGGDVSAAAGNVEIAGTVHGDVSAGAGNVVIAEGATVGALQAGAGNVAIDGTVAGDAAIGADTITLGEAAAIEGDLRYDGSLEGNTGAVAGDVTRDSTLGFDVAPTIQPLASWVFALYALALNLLLGAALLALFPSFSTRVADRVASDPLRSGLVGLLVLVGIPVLLVAIAITVIGIPISIVGALAFALLVWVGVVYGRFAVAAWALSYADVDNRWVALVVGLVAGALLAQLPYLGGLLNFLIFLLGLGALSMALYGHRRRVRESRAAVGPDEPTTA